ncbi:MAG: acyltransferase [Citromicrobium sp.]|nr:acyltransferase [Citromicrobium sp.]
MTAQSAYRPEIDGLRSIAVVPVILFHAGFGLFSGGFVGVDIFFVISGFLITSIIAREMQAGRFSLLTFYERRARRILPALFLIMLLCLPVAWQILVPRDLKDFAQSLVAVSTFTSNILFWRETGYFGTEAELKPLLHTWSLAVEEQFYFVWPAVLVLGFRFAISRAWLTALLVASSFLYAQLAFDALSESYYSPFARAWELLSGGLAAIILNRVGWTYFYKWGPWLAALGIGLMAISMLMPLAVLDFATWTPLIPVVGTLLVILGGETNWMSRILIQNRLVVWTGLISYSLYLWHWPILSFATIVYDAMPPHALRVAGIALSFLIAWASWRFIEEPARKVWSFRKLGILLAAILVASGAVIAFVLLRPLSAEERRDDRVNDLIAGWDWDYSENEICREAYGDEADTFCYQSRTGAPEIVLIGDSLANHLTPGIIDQPRFEGANVLSIGRCGLVAWTSVEPSQCELQDRVLAASDKVDLVIVGGGWPAIDEQGRFDFKSRSVRVADPYGVRFRKDLLARLRSFARPGRRIVVVGPKPELGYDVRRCFGRPLVAPSGTCRLTARQVEGGSTQRVRAMLKEVVDQVPGAILVDPAPLFCDANGCDYVSREGLPYLRDNVHFSTLGSDRVAGLIAQELARSDR